MKLSDKTLDVLKNFSTINTGLYFKAGNVISTVSKSQTIMAQATIEEEFATDFVVYDLNRFLALVSLMDDPDIEVVGKQLKISDSSSTVTYGLSDETMIVWPNQGVPEVDNSEVNFSMSKETLQQIMRMGGVLGLPNVVFRGDRKAISVAAMDTKNSGSDVGWIDVGETTAEFQSIFVAENFKLIPGDYECSVSTEGIAQFKNTSANVEYWVPTEAGSTYSD
jgi:hypothetical protein